MTGALGLKKNCTYSMCAVYSCCIVVVIKMERRELPCTSTREYGFIDPLIKTVVSVDKKLLKYYEFVSDHQFPRKFKVPNHKNRFFLIFILEDTYLIFL